MAKTPHALVHNWRLKASALAMSVFLWALVQTEPRTEEVFPSVPLRVEVGDTMWTVSAPPSPATVELRLDGPAREIIRLAREGPTVRVPIGRVGSRDTVIALRRDWVELGDRSGLVIESVSPAAIRLTLEPAVRRQIPVSARVQGRVREHLALASNVTVSPLVVQVRGPESRVLALDSIPTRAFDLSRVASSGSYRVAVDTTGLGGASINPPTASLDIRVEDMVERVLSGLAVQADVGPGEEDVVVEPSSIQLTLTGARTLVTALDPSALRIWVPPEFLQDMEPGEERQVQLVVDGVPELVRAEPATRYIRVRRAIDVASGDDGGWPLR